MAEAMPFLTFQPARGHTASEAMACYTGLFSDGAVLSEQRRGPGSPMGGAGTIEVAEFVVAGQHVRCSDGLAEGGTFFMPLDDYGFGPFAWVQDRFGVSWQLSGPPA